MMHTVFFFFFFSLHEEETFDRCTMHTDAGGLKIASFSLSLSLFFHVMPNEIAGGREKKSARIENSIYRSGEIKFAINEVSFQIKPHRN